MNTVHGEDVTDDSLQVYYLDEIVVTATRYDMALKDLSATVSVVTESDIDGMNLRNSTDILANLPGGSAGLYKMTERSYTVGLSYRF